MKFIIVLILSLFISLNGISQDTTKVDTICFTADEISNLYDNITKLEIKDSLNDLIISQYKVQIINYKNLTFEDSIYSNLSNQESKILQNQVDFYRNLYEKNKPKWYESKFMWFSFGVASSILIFQSTK